MERAVELAVEEQRLTEEEEKLRDRAYNLMRVFAAGCSPYHDAAREGRRIARLDDPRQDEPGAKKKTLQLHTLKSTINNCVADIVQAFPHPRFIPERADLQPVAEDLGDLVSWIMQNNRYDKLHRRYAEDFLCTGTFVAQVGWDKDMADGRGDVAVLRWPIEAFLWDPYTDNVQDGRACIKMSWHPLSWYDEHYPEQAKYISGETPDDGNNGLPDSQRLNMGHDEGQAMLMEFWWREYNPKSRRYTVNVAYFANKVLLYKKENVYAHGMYPFVLTPYDLIEGQPVGDGLVAELAPMMRYINRYAAYLDMNARMGSKGRLLTREGSGINPDSLADWSQDIIVGERITPGEDWSWLQSAPISSTVVQQMMRMQNELKMDSGQNQYSRGENTAGLVSGRAIEALQNAGGKVMALRVSDFSNGYQSIIEQVLWLVAEFYDESRHIEITGKNARTVAVNRKRLYGGEQTGALPAPPYSVRIEIEHRNEDRVNAENSLYMQAFSMAAQMQQFFPLSALFEMMHVDGKDRLMPVLRENEKHQQQMQQMSQQLEQQTAQLEALQKDNQSLKGMNMQMSSEMAKMNAQLGTAPQARPQGKQTAAGRGAQRTAQVDAARLLNQGGQVR